MFRQNIIKDFHLFVPQSLSSICMCHIFKIMKKKVWRMFGSGFCKKLQFSSCPHIFIFSQPLQSVVWISISSSVCLFFNQLFQPPEGKLLLLITTYQASYTSFHLQQNAKRHLYVITPTYTRGEQEAELVKI